MVPAANLIGFGGEELARKLPKVIGIVIETTLGSIVEIVLFAILITKPETGTFHPVQIIQAAILGSILANLLLCVGGCFFVGGLKREEQEFHEAVSEVGSGLMLVAGSKFSLFHEMSAIFEANDALTCDSGSGSSCGLRDNASELRVCLLWRF